MKNIVITIIAAMAIMSVAQAHQKQPMFVKPAPHHSHCIIAPPIHKHHKPHKHHKHNHMHGEKFTAPVTPHHHLPAKHNCHLVKPKHKH